MRVYSSVAEPVDLFASPAPACQNCVSVWRSGFGSSFDSAISLYIKKIINFTFSYNFHVFQNISNPQTALVS
jgi:hypothetical protein